MSDVTNEKREIVISCINLMKDFIPATENVNMYDEFKKIQLLGFVDVFDNPFVGVSKMDDLELTVHDFDENYDDKQTKPLIPYMEWVGFFNTLLHDMHKSCGESVFNNKSNIHLSTFMFILEYIFLYQKRMKHPILGCESAPEYFAVLSKYVAEESIDTLNAINLDEKKLYCTSYFADVFFHDRDYLRSFHTRGLFDSDFSNALKSLTSLRLADIELENIRALAENQSLFINCFGFNSAILNPAYVFNALSKGNNSEFIDDDVLDLCVSYAEALMNMFYFESEIHPSTFIHRMQNIYLYISKVIDLPYTIHDGIELLDYMSGYLKSLIPFDVSHYRFVRYSD